MTELNKVRVFTGLTLFNLAAGLITKKKTSELSRGVIDCAVNWQ